jgi:16S rRNA (guanine966-N2)-methyltransferase
MRVIAGRLGGRNFVSPRGHRTHPMSDKVRGALFNALGDVDGLSLLDAFAGSGALSYEAVSRGAAHALAIDADQAAQQAIVANITSLGLSGQVKLIKASVGAWLSTADEEFDIVLCDPPYDDPQPKLLERLAERTKPSGVAVFSLPPAVKFELAEPYELLTRKNYGDAQLFFYRRRA